MIKLKYILMAAMLALTVSSCSNIPSMEFNKNNCTIPTLRATAYCRQEFDHLKYRNKSAIGTTLQTHKSLACDWSRIPLGTILSIAGESYLVEDIGSALVARPLSEPPTIDVYVSGKREMNKFGLKFFDNIKVIQWGSFEESAKILEKRLKYKHCRVMYQRIKKKIK